MTITSAEINVHGAFELLIESLEEEVNFINNTGASAFQRGDYSAVDTLRARVDGITALREKVLALRVEWERMMPPAEEPEDDGDPVSRRDLGRISRGVRTPNQAFEVPILTALVTLGGRGRMADVLAKVEQLMRDRLTEVDFQPLRSDPDSVRWRNTAQWTRFTLVQHGDLRDDSPRGIWEITEQGRRRAEQ